MSAKSLTSAALALPLADRVSLAQALWQSIDAGLPDTDERSAVQDAARRDAALTSGTVAGAPHAEVMQAARRATGCK